ncbi:MAG: AmmeMemoRadiSam system protein A [Pseudomonadota bacterium]
MKTPSPERGPLLTHLARAAIASHFGYPTPPLPHPPWLDEHGACFVTLTRQGHLRGCIGSLEAHRPLGQDLEMNAQAAAFRDPRFPPLLEEELEHIRVEVSLLSPPEPLPYIDETDALAQLRPGIDGLIFEAEGHRSTFLPQVWEQLPNPREFLGHLKQKAGLPAHYWSNEVRLSRYTVEKFKEVQP